MQSKPTTARPSDRLHLSGSSVHATPDPTRSGQNGELTELNYWLVATTFQCHASQSLSSAVLSLLPLNTCSFFVSLTHPFHYQGCYNLLPQVFRLNRNLFSLSQFVLQELEDQDVFRSSPFTEQQSHCCGSFSLSLSLGQVSVSFFRLVATLRW